VVSVINLRQISLLLLGTEAGVLHVNPRIKISADLAVSEFPS
jgi:hypothetical protein